MTFEIAFDDSSFEGNIYLEKIGAVKVPTGSTKYPPFEVFKIEISSPEDMERITDTLEQELGTLIHLNVSFDPPCIYIV